MRLSALHRKVLENYKRFHDQPPTIRGLMAMSAINHIGLIMVFAALVAISLALDEKCLAAGLVGTILGTLGRDLGWYRKSVQIWPVLNIIVDWNKMDAILSADGDIDQSS